MDDKQRRKGWDGLIEVWNRRKWLAILLFAGPFVATVSLALALPDLYRSTATVLVEHQQVPESFVKASVTGEAEIRLQTISQEIMSRSRILDLITHFNLYPEFRGRVPLEGLVERMRRDIQLELKEMHQQTANPGATIAFSLSYRGRDPETVAQVTNSLASMYVEANVKMRGRQATETVVLLKAQLEEMKRRQEEQERRLSEFKHRHMGELPEQMQANLATLQGLNADLHLNSQNQIRITERRDKLAKELVEASVGGSARGAASGPDTLPGRLERSRVELTELRTRASEKHPDVIRLKGEIAALEHKLTELAREAKLDPAQTAVLVTSPTELKQVLRDVDAELKAVKAEEQRLRKDLATYQRRVEKSPQHEQEFQQLERDYKMTKDLYYSLLQRYEDAQLAGNMEQRQKGEQFRILDSAIPSKSPAAPNRLKLILIGLILSAGLAAATVLLAEQRDTSFHKVEDLRAFTKVPVLVSIPRIVTDADRRRSHWQFCLRTTASGLSLVLIIGVTYYVAHGNEPLVWLLGGGRS